MRFLSRVVWSEGMYLAPHHFEAQSRFAEDTLAFLMGSLWAEPWGFSHVEMDMKAIENGRVAIRSAGGLFPDGLSFDVPASDTGPAERELGKALSPAVTASVLHLAVPVRREIGFNSDVTEPRFRPKPQVIRDETNGTEEAEIEVGEKALRVMLEDELTPELVSLPLARVIRDGSGRLRYDENFVPPCLRVSASVELTTRLARLLETLAEKSAAVQAGTTHGRAGFSPGMSAIDVANFWFLHALHSELPPLRHLVTTRRAHPSDVFTELSRLAGALCTFSTDADVRELPTYDHRDPGPGFQALEEHIRRLLDVVVPSNVVLFEFESMGPYLFQAEVRDRRALRHARWILGVRAAVGESDLLGMVPRLVKLCSARFVPELVRRALPGMRLTHVPVPPSELRPQADMQYFAVDRAGACWQHILRTATVGLYVPGEIAAAEFTLSAIVETTG